MSEVAYAVRHPQVLPRAVFLSSSSCVICSGFFSCSLPALISPPPSSPQSCSVSVGSLLWRSLVGLSQAGDLCRLSGLRHTKTSAFAGWQRRYDWCALGSACPVMLRQFDCSWPRPSLCLSFSALQLWVLRPFPLDCRALCHGAPSKTPAACSISLLTTCAACSLHLVASTANQHSLGFFWLGCTRSSREAPSCPSVCDAQFFCAQRPQVMWMERPNCARSMWTQTADPS